MKNLGLLLFFYCISVALTAQTRTGESFGMVAGDASFDNSVAFQAAVSEHLNGTLETLTLEGDYNFDCEVDLNEANGLSIIGLGETRSSITTDTLFSIIVNTGTTANIRFRNIKFEATTAANPNDKKGHENALLWLAKRANAHTWLIENCEFTAPNALTNGIKVYVSEDVLVKDITIRDSYFHDLGRMGVETVNHKKPLALNRIRNILFEGNLVARTGRINYGMGVSLSGRSEASVVRKNTFEDNPNCAVEIAGNKNISILNNTMQGSGSAVHIVVGPGIVNDSIVMRRNRADVQEGNVYINAQAILSEGNSWVSKTRGFMQGLDGFNANGDTIKASEIAVFQVFGSDTRPTQNIRFDNCAIASQANIPIVSYNANKGTVADIEINCSEVRIPSGQNFGKTKYGNTTRYVNNRQLDIKASEFTKCLPLVVEDIEEVPKHQP